MHLLQRFSVAWILFSTLSVERFGETQYIDNVFLLQISTISGVRIYYPYYLRAVRNAFTHSYLHLKVSGILWRCAISLKYFFEKMQKIFGRLKKSLYLCNALGNDAVPWAKRIVLWCNGSTAVFGSACLGSNPGKTTTCESLLIKMANSLFYSKNVGKVWKNCW